MNLNPVDFDRGFGRKSRDRHGECYEIPAHLKVGSSCLLTDHNSPRNCSQKAFMLAPVVRREKSLKLSSSGLKTERSNGRMNDAAKSALEAVQERFALPSPETLEAAAKVNGELSRCRYPVGQIKCECTADSLSLTGVTSRYYYVQVALETALRHAGLTPVHLNVVVAQQF